jgi:hypothetical protein
MKKYLVLTIVLIGMLVAGCSAAERSELKSLGNRHCVTQFSGGELIATYVSTGVVMSQSDSDGYYFEDYFDGKRLVRVSGDVNIYALENNEVKNTADETCAKFIQIEKQD